MTTPNDLKVALARNPRELQEIFSDKQNCHDLKRVIGIYIEVSRLSQAKLMADESISAETKVAAYNYLEKQKETLVSIAASAQIQ